jgi:soluble lytic murein transglycosylase-like protein
MRGYFALVMLCLMSAPAAAGTLYRCEAADGSRSYSNANRAADKGERCIAIGVFADAPAKATAPAPPPKAPSVDFRAAPAGQTPAAPVSQHGARVSRGAVYRYEVDGITHYTNVRPADARRAKVLFSYIETCYACAASAVDFARVALNLGAYRDEVASAAREFAVDESLVRAVIHAESAFNPNAVSHKGAQGLMQLMPATAGRFGVADPFTAGQNIRGGVAYLAWLLKRFKGDQRLAAAAYNAGEGAVDRNGGVPPYAETQRYVDRVAVLAQRYQVALKGG